MTEGWSATTILSNVEGDETGLRLESGAGEKHVAWQEITSTHFYVKRRWLQQGTKTVRYSLQVRDVFVVSTADGPLGIFTADRDTMRGLAGALNAMTRHLPYEWTENDSGWTRRARPGIEVPAPRPPIVSHSDDEATFQGGSGGRQTRNRLILLVVATAAWSWWLPWSQVRTDPGLWAVFLVFTLVPAFVIVPLVLWNAWQDFGFPVYRVSSRGDSFVVVRHRFRNETTQQGRWSAVMAATHEMGTQAPQNEFVVALEDGHRVVIDFAERYPALVTWLSARAPLDYEWIPIDAIAGRTIFEINDPFARVVRGSPGSGAVPPR